MVILLGGIKVGVSERTPIPIAPPINNLRVLTAPAFKPTLLFMIGSAGLSIFGHNSGLKVVSQSNHQMHGTARRTTRERLPGITRQPTEAVRELLGKAPARQRARSPRRNRREKIGTITVRPVHRHRILLLIAHLGLSKSRGAKLRAHAYRRSPSDAREGLRPRTPMEMLPTVNASSP